MLPNPMLIITKEDLFVNFFSLMAFHLELFSPNGHLRSGRQISWRRGLKWSGLGV